MTEIFPSEFSTSTKKLKIVLLGDRSVGKSSIIRRFTSNHFQECLSPTVGVDFMTKKLKYKNCFYKLQLWDTAGQQKYRSLVKGYLKGADACIFVYDCSRVESYQTLLQWIKIFDQISTYESFKIIAANKSDIEIKQKDFQEKKKNIKKNHKQLQELTQMQVSAKTGYNIQELIQQILHQCWFCKTLHDVGTSKTIKTICSQKQLDSLTDKWKSCCK